MSYDRDAGAPSAPRRSTSGSCAAPRHEVGYAGGTHLGSAPEHGTPLPKHFCWTRFGAEAGQGPDQILNRKERERLDNDGIFLWGIGNAVGHSIQELVRRERRPEVIFSPIRSEPRKQDVTPDQILVWTAGRTPTGERYALPRGSTVTSGTSSGRVNPKRYALVCASRRPLRITENAQEVPFGSLRNLVSGRPVGWSQVTAVVRVEKAIAKSPPAPVYAAAIRTELVHPYIVELLEPVLLSGGALPRGGPLQLDRL
jgi:hypothetical protein